MITIVDIAADIPLQSIRREPVASRPLAMRKRKLRTAGVAETMRLKAREGVPIRALRGGLA